jgi:hypothetical protein
LQAVVTQSDKTVFEIADGALFTLPKDRQYRLAVKGEAENGAFSLSWKIE